MRTTLRAFALLIVTAMIIVVLGGCATTPTATPAASSQTTSTSVPVVQAGTSAATSAPTAAGKPKDTLAILSAESFTGSWDPTGSTVLANIHLEDLVFDRLWEIDWA